MKGRFAMPERQWDCCRGIPNLSVDQCLIPSLSLPLVVELYTVGWLITRLTLWQPLLPYG